MFKRPIVAIAIGMVVGIFVGYTTGLPLQFVYIGFFVFTMASLVAWVLEKKVERGITFIFICLSAFFLGITLFQGERQSLLQQARALGVGDSRSRQLIFSIRGTICAFPETRSVYPIEGEGEGEEENETEVGPEMNKVSFPLKIEEVKIEDAWQDMDGKILVNIYREIASLPLTSSGARHGIRMKFKIGDQLEIKGYLRELPGIRNPADFDYGVYLLRNGIIGQMGIKEGEKLSQARDQYVKILSRNNINFLERMASRGRDYMEKIIDLGPYDGREGLLKAMLIGKREGLDENLKTNFVNTGTVHIMAISGLNMVIVMAIILAGCKLIFCPQRWANIFCLISLILYALLTGGRASVWRATVMAGLLLAGRFFNRQVDKWTSLSLAALIILFISPSSLFDSGFQLTFMAVGGLMYFYPRLEGVVRIRSKPLFERALSRYFLKSILVVLAAQLALGPFLIYYYYRFPLTTFMANLVVVPSLGIVTVLGFVSSLAGLVSIQLAQAFNATNSSVLLIMDRVTSFLASWPGQLIYLAKPDPLLFIFYYLVLFLIFHPFKESSS